MLQCMREGDALHLQWSVGVRGESMIRGVRDGILIRNKLQLIYVLSSLSLSLSFFLSLVILSHVGDRLIFSLPL